MTPSSFLRSVVRPITALGLGAVLALGCADTTTDEGDAEQGEAAFTGTPNEDIGQFFMIEHFGVVASGFADVHTMVRSKNLGALILWNPEQASGATARTMVQSYARTAHASNHAELFVAADQEEKGTQRFKSRHGFTNLASGATLGAVVEREGNAKVCELHARITSREMAAVGMNMTLGTVSDLFTRDSGTPGMFRSRAIDADVNTVTSCIQAMTKAYGEEGHVVFVTKHFPGLGNASGNTDVDPSVHTFSNTKAKIENELSPYRHATAAVNAVGSAPLFGAMVSHASYPILDATGTPATLSEPILTELLRSGPTTSLTNGKDKDGQAVAIEGMNLKGLTVSDAFWTWGAMKNLGGTEKRRMMARAFLAGMDILMIAKADFNGAWDYFQALHAGQLPDAEKAALTVAAHEPSFSALQAKFRARVIESAARVKASKEKVGGVATFAGQGEAREASQDLTPEYTRLVQ